MVKERHYGRYAPWRLSENIMRKSWASWFAVGRDPHTPFDPGDHRGKPSWKAGIPGYWEE